MNVDLEKNDKNQENFEKKKKIIVISLSAAIVFITLIAGLFFVRKNKESSHENDDLEKVIDNEKKNNENDDDNKNEEIIVNGSDYFFEKKAGLVTINILSFLIIGILFFFWENDKLPFKKSIRKCELLALSFVCCGSESENKSADSMGVGLFEKSNWFGFATLGALIVITFLVEFILNCFLIGSISHFLSKDKSKKCRHTLKMSLRMSWKKRIQYFLSFSIAKTLFIALSYLLCGFIIAIFARLDKKYHPCCCRTGEIITGHGANYCCGYCEVVIENKKPAFILIDNSEKLNTSNEIEKLDAESDKDNSSNSSDSSFNF